MAPPSVSETSDVRFEVEPERITLVKIGRDVICTLHGSQTQWHWRMRAPIEAAITPHGPLTVGATLRYGKDRQPEAVFQPSGHR